MFECNFKAFSGSGAQCWYLNAVYALVVVVIVHWVVWREEDSFIIHY